MKGNHTRKMRMIMALATGFGISNISQAISLGSIQVNSYLGEPLKAAIRVSDVDPANIGNVTISLASDNDYRRFGVVRTAEQDNLRFQLLSVGNTYIINVDSNNTQMHEPFVNFVLSVKDSTKEYTREYSIFLDPDPRVQAGIRPTTSTTNTTDNQGWGGAREIQVQSAPTRESASVSTRRPDTSHIRAENGRYQVHRGDTLYSIANALRPAHIPVQTMMNALFNSNPKAFADGSKDGLIAGAVLVIPENIEQAARNTKRVPSVPPTETPVETKTEIENESSITEILEIETAEEESATEAALENEEGETKEVQTPLSEIETLEEEALQIEDEEAPLIADERTENEEEILEIETEEYLNDAQEETLLLDDPSSLQDETLNHEEILDTNHEEIPDTNSEEIIDTNTNDEEETLPAPTTLPQEPNNPITENTSDISEIAPTATSTVTESVSQQNAPSAVALPERSFSFPLWQMIAAAIVVLAFVGAVAGFIITKGRKKKAIEKEVANNEEIDFDNFDEETFKQLEEEINVQMLHDEEKEEQNDDVFFNNAEENQEPQTGDDLFSDHASNSEQTEENLDSSEEISVDTPTQQENEDNFQELDDFFTEENADEETPKKISDSDTNNEDYLDFDDLSDFFDEEDEPQQDTKQEHDNSEQFDNFEEFIDESEPSLSEESNENKNESITPSEDTLAFDSDIFFADLSDNDNNEENQSSLEEVSLELDDFFSEENEISKTENTAKDESKLPEELNEAIALAEEAQTKKQEPTPETVQAMGINIDLATAYIRSGVKLEKAKMWLEEVLQKGNDEQKAEATEILKKIQ